MNEAIIREISEIVKSKADDSTKLLKIETLVGLAEKITRPESSTQVRAPHQPVQPASKPVGGPGAIIGVENIN